MRCLRCFPLLANLHLCVSFCSKVRDSEQKIKELEEQMETLKKEMEESQGHSDKGETTKILVQSQQWPC